VIRATGSYMTVFVVYSIFLVLSLGLFQIYFQRRLAERARLGPGAAVQPSRA